MSLTDLISKIFARPVGTPAQPPATGDQPTEGATGTAPTVGSVAGAVAGAVESAAGGDVMQVLKDLASKSSENLDWQHSIVDLLKLVGHDSSHAAREKLADELGYTGDKSDSAAMNQWLLTQVMAELTKTGGKLPEGQ